MNTFTVTDNPLAIHCALCGMTSHNHGDVKALYCSHCQMFHVQALPIVTVYEHPRDYPKNYVVRMCASYDGAIIQAKDPMGVCANLKEAQALIPPGMVRLPRQRNDGPSIVECWI